jgi:N6-adenosine-specific RNA methylase IME4
LVKLEYSYGGVVKCLSKWIFEILSWFSWETTTELGKRQHDLRVISWSDQELRVSSISLFDISLINVRQTTRVRFSPLGLESYTSPVLWEINI